MRCSKRYRRKWEQIMILLVMEREALLNRQMITIACTVGRVDLLRWSPNPSTISKVNILYKATNILIVGKTEDNKS
jgi:hypothetical protein